MNRKVIMNNRRTPRTYVHKHFKGRWAETYQDCALQCLTNLLEHLDGVNYHTLAQALIQDKRRDEVVNNPGIILEEWLTDPLTPNPDSIVRILKQQTNTEWERFKIPPIGNPVSAKDIAIWNKDFQSLAITTSSGGVDHITAIKSGIVYDYIGENILTRSVIDVYWQNNLPGVDCLHLSPPR